MNATESKTSDSERDRRWFRFSLRTLLIAMLVLGTGLGVLGVQMKLKSYLLPVWQDEAGRIHVQSPGFWDEREYHRDHPSAEAARARERHPEAIILVEEGNILYHTWHPDEEWRWGS